MGRKEIRTLYLDEDNPCHNLPERNFLLAILERACRDLLPCADKHVRNETINWFTVNGNCVKKDPLKFTFNDIILELGFGIKELEYFESMVQEAIQYEELRYQDPSQAAENWKKIKKERKMRRVRMGKFS